MGMRDGDIVSKAVRLRCDFLEGLEADFTPV